MIRSWIVLFNELDMKPHYSFLLKMPNAFISTDHGLTDLILDATEFKFQFATNFEFNSIMFFITKIHQLKRP